MGSDCTWFPFVFHGFHVFNWFAIFLVSLLFSTYQKCGLNVLLRSLCCVMIMALLLIEAGYLFMGKEPYNNDAYQDFAIIQAIVLNYCFISAQAHSACMMVNNCLLALGWRFGEWEKLLDRSLLFLFLSYGLPVVPTFILGIMMPDFSKQIMYPFFSFVPVGLMFSCCTFWLLICAIPGNIASIYIMYKTVQLRRQTLEMTSYTQINRVQLLRLFVAMLIYIVISLGSAIPLLLVDPELYKHPENFLGSAALKSPWRNIKLCCPSPDEDDRLMYYYRVRCPGVLSFLPPLMAVGIFLMYGFGTPMKAALRQVSVLVNKTLKRPKRRMSHATVEMSDTEGEYEIQVTGGNQLPTLDEEDEDAQYTPAKPKPGVSRRRNSPSM